MSDRVSEHIRSNVSCLLAIELAAPRAQRPLVQKAEDDRPSPAVGAVPRSAAAVPSSPTAAPLWARFLGCVAEACGAAASMSLLTPPNTPGTQFWVKPDDAPRDADARIRRQ